MGGDAGARLALSAAAVTAKPPTRAGASADIATPSRPGLDALLRESGLVLAWNDADGSGVKLSGFDERLESGESLTGYRPELLGNGGEIRRTASDDRRTWLLSLASRDHSGNSVR